MAFARTSNAPLEQPLVLTPTERRDAVAIIGWSQRQLADRAGYDESWIRRLFRDDQTQAPLGFDDWLRVLAAFHTEHQAPQRQAQHRG
jgi:AraC-like DNA-binding protein